MSGFRLEKLRPESDDFLHLDFLRIVAALGIVAYHWRGSLDLPTTAAGWPFMEALSAFVDLFFVISGFIIFHIYATRLNTAGAYVGFLKRRFARLAPLHYATLAIYVAIGIGAPMVGVALNEPAKYDMACVVPNVLFVHAMGTCQGLSFNFPSWSISAEMACYLLFPLVIVLARLRPWAPGAAAIAMLAALYAIGATDPAHRYWFDLTYDWSPLRALPAFALGVSLYAMRDRLKHIPRPGLLMFALLVSFVPMAAAGVWQGILTPLTYVITLLGVAADMRGRPGWVVRTFAPWGQLTYSVYMLHALFMTLAFTLVYERILHLEGAAKSIAVVATFPVLMGVSYLSYMLFEKPARRWITALGSR